MSGRIFSRVVYRLIALATVATCLTTISAESTAQTGFFTDPQTGIVYRKVSRTVEKPVVETKIEQQHEVVYRPQTVTETKPHNRTVMTPVVEYKWKPKLTGRWNPFRPPSIRYERIPHTKWEAHNEVVHQTRTTTEWIVEKRTIDVPQRTVRTTRQHSVAYEPVGRISPVNNSNLPTEVAARLEPLNQNATFRALEPSGIAATLFVPPRIAANTVTPNHSGTLTRNTNQSGMAVQNLMPQTQTPLGNDLPNSTGIANQRPLPTFR